MADLVGAGSMFRTRWVLVWVGSLGWNLVGGCCPEFPQPFRAAKQGLVGVVDEVVAVDAYEGHLVDVGVAFEWGVPRDQMMRFALGNIGPTADTAFVSGDQAPYLCWCGVALLATLVENFAIGTEHGCRNSAVAGIPGENGVGYDISVGEFGSVLTRHKVVELHPHMNVALHRPRPGTGATAVVAFTGAGSSEAAVGGIKHALTACARLLGCWDVASAVSFPQFLGGCFESGVHFVDRLVIAFDQQCGHTVLGVEAADFPVPALTSASFLRAVAFVDVVVFVDPASGDLVGVIG